MAEVNLSLRNKVGKDVRCIVGELEFVVPAFTSRMVAVEKGTRLSMYAEGLDYDYWKDDLNEDIAIDIVRSGRQLQTDRGPF